MSIIMFLIINFTTYASVFIYVHQQYSTIFICLFVKLFIVYIMIHKLSIQAFYSMEGQTSQKIEKKTYIFPFIRYLSQRQNLLGLGESHALVADVELGVVAGNEGVAEDPGFDGAEVEAQDPHDAHAGASLVHVLGGGGRTR